MKKPTMTRTQKKLTNMHAAGFRDGVENATQGFLASLRVLGFKALADELERRERPAYRELSPFAECLIKPTRVGKGKKAKLVFRKSKEARALKRATSAFTRLVRAEAKVMRAALRLVRSKPAGIAIKGERPMSGLEENVRLFGSLEENEAFKRFAVAELTLRNARKHLRRALREVE